MNALTTALQGKGITSRTINYFSSYLSYNSCQDISFAAASKNEAILKIKVFAAHLLSEYDIFHFHFGTSLTADHYDLPLLKPLGKKAIMHYWGFDIRQFSIAKKYNLYAIKANIAKVQIIKKP